MNSAKPPTFEWARSLKFLHWLIAAAIAVAAPAGYVMSTTFAASFRDPLIGDLHTLSAQIHHTLGFLLILATLLYVAVRVRKSRPPYPSAPRWQTALTILTHTALVFLLVAIPWSGWTALSSLADTPTYGQTHIWLFGTDQLMPRIWPALPPEDPTGYSRFATWHRRLLWAGGAFLSLHLLAVLWHHWVKRDNVLRRLWPLAHRDESADSKQRQSASPPTHKPAQ